MSNWAYNTAGFERCAYTIDGVETVVHAIGDGPPLVYFHGGGTFHGFEWARDLADKFRVIVPYHPNFGESGDADFTGLDDYLLHYEMLFAALELETFHLIGASMGGHMAALYAGAHADEIDRLVLISPAGLTSPDAAMPDFAQIAPGDLSGWFVTDPEWVKPYWPDAPSPEWQAMRAREAAAAALTREDAKLADGNIRAALAEFAEAKRPALLMWGTGDRIVPPGFAPAWQALLPHAELRLIEGGGHLLLDENAASRAAVREFLLG